jgi:hypothetical protein
MAHLDDSIVDVVDVESAQNLAEQAQFEMLKLSYSGSRSRIPHVSELLTYRYRNAFFQPNY